MSVPTKMGFENAASMGLSKEEWERVCTHLGRLPNLCELGIFSAMWSEHCSYKSSKKWLKTLPTQGERVIQGPGENAGVVDIGDGLAVVFKIESHNHPSFIELYQGAATGGGGILRVATKKGKGRCGLHPGVRRKPPSLPSSVLAHSEDGTFSPGAADERVAHAEQDSRQRQHFPCSECKGSAIAVEV